jgi:uncharacterized protein Yka (UPF0111/DUF47 family)
MSRKLSWFLPENPDVLGMLCQQAATTITGMEALQAWASGDGTAEERLRATEHLADQQKRDLRLALTTAFITPIGAEDVYVLSERLDAVLNGAKDAVREAEVMAMPPDDAVRGMVELLVQGVRHLAVAFERLGPRSGDEQSATDAADEAVKTQRQVERVYRKAMSALLGVDDLREVMGRREVYRRFARIADRVDEVAERVWYASVKEV